MLNEKRAASEGRRLRLTPQRARATVRAVRSRYRTRAEGGATTFAIAATSALARCAIAGRCGAITGLDRSPGRDRGRWSW